MSFVASPLSAFIFAIASKPSRHSLAKWKTPAISEAASRKPVFGVNTVVHLHVDLLQLE